MRAFSFVLRVTVIASLTAVTLLGLISTAAPRDETSLVAHAPISDDRPPNGVTPVVDRVLLPK